MTTSSDFIDAPSERKTNAPAQPDRIHRLETEISELRDTVARFAELVIGEVKDLRHAQAEPVTPDAFGETPDQANAGHPESRMALASRAATARRPWLLMELIRDFSATVRMYLDPRYRVRRSTQLLVPAIIGLFVLNCFLFNAVFSVPILSQIVEKLGDVILAILLYKVVSRELVRYRQVIAQLLEWQEHRGRIGAVVVGAEPATSRLETE
jgi:hypothetical protein